ncbi:MAG TPA: S9 family peptidase, partial [Caulobacteraceae bacterium]
MRSALRSALLGLSALTLAAAAPLAVEARPFTARDMQSLDRVSDPRLSPDGQWVVYQVRVADIEANRGRTSLWIMPAGGGEARQLAATVEGASSPRWVGQHIYFASSRGGSSQVWRTDAQGATATQVTNLPLDVGSFSVTPDEGRIVVSLAVFPDCETVACTVERTAATAARKTTGVVYDELFIRHWDAWADGTRNHLFSAPLDASGAAGPLVRMTPGFDGDTPSKPFGGDEEWTFTPDARSLVFSARVAGRIEPTSTNFDLFRAPLDGSAAPENLTEANLAWDTGAAYSPDGRWMAYRAMKRPGFEADRYAIMLRDVATGQTRELAADWDRSADDIKWSPDGRTIYAL